MTQSQCQTTVVIVSYKSRGTIDKALSALEPTCKAGEAKCVLVDNEPSDGCADYVREAYPFVKVLPSQGNLGFGRGCNLGAEWADTPYLLFLNPDAAISRESLKTLVDFMDQHPACGIAAPAIPMHKAGMLLTPKGLLFELFGVQDAQIKDTIPGEEPFRTNWVCGAALMIRTDLFRELSGFDPRFFMYFEETDLCLRASQTGAEIWVVPSAEAVHEAGSSSRQSGEHLAHGNVSRHYYQSRNYYLAKHHGLLKGVSVVAAELAVLSTRSLKYWVSKRGNPAGVRARAQAGVFLWPPKPERSSTTHTAGR